MNTFSSSKYLVLVFVLGVLGGVLSAPLTYKFLPQPKEVVREVIREHATDTTGTLQQTNFFDEESATMSVVKDVNEAVVSIAIFREFNSTQVQTFPFGDLFEGFESPLEPSMPSEPGTSPDSSRRQQVGGGSGFIIEPDGLIVTNRHVVGDSSSSYVVILADGTQYEAEVVAKDPVLDVALIQIEATDLPTLRLGDSDQLELGQTVIAIGNALSEFGNTVTRGVVSGVGRRVEAGNGRGFTEVLDEAIQTDAAINPGNSGGPLLNLAGEVIGINTAVSSRGQSLGFAIPINSVKKTIESVRTTGRIVRPWLGVRYRPITPRLAELNNLPVTYGALVLRGETSDELAVIPGSPADKAGLVENDIILEINEHPLDDRDSLVKEVAKYAVGDTITLLVLHKGEEKVIEVTLGEFPQQVK